MKTVNLFNSPSGFVLFFVYKNTTYIVGHEDTGNMGRLFLANLQNNGWKSQIAKGLNVFGGKYDASTNEILTQDSHTIYVEEDFTDDAREFLPYKSELELLNLINSLTKQYNLN